MWRSTSERFRFSGGAPVRLTLQNRSKEAPAVYALNLDGTRERKLDSVFRNGTLSLAFDTSRFEYGTPFFEIVYP